MNLSLHPLVTRRLVPLLHQVSSAILGGAGCFGKFLCDILVSPLTQQVGGTVLTEGSLAAVVNSCFTSCRYFSHAFYAPGILCSWR